MTTTTPSPAKFSTITGPDWGRALVSARARRGDRKHIVTAQAITAGAATLSLFR